MPNIGRDAADAARGLAEAAGVPAVVQPAAKEIGDVLGRSVRAALAPIRGLLWSLEQVEAFVFESVTEKLRNVRPEDIVDPPLTIAGPVYEALRFAGHDEALRDMYATLLATAMDATTAGTAHPSFVEIIRRLSPDEAKLLQHVAIPLGRELLTIRRGLKDAPGNWNGEWAHLSHYSEMADLVRPDLVPTYLTNAARLGLVTLDYSSKFASPDMYNRLKEMPAAKSISDQLTESDEWHPMFVEGMVSVTSFGELFFRACVFQHPIHLPREGEPPPPQSVDV